MKRLQLLTFLLAALPSTPALVLNTGMSCRIMRYGSAMEKQHQATDREHLLD